MGGGWGFGVGVGASRRPNVDGQGGASETTSKWVGILPVRKALKIYILLCAHSAAQKCKLQVTCNTKGYILNVFIRIYCTIVRFNVLYLRSVS